MREAAEFSADAEAEARRLLTAAFETVPIRPGLAADLVSAAGPDGAASPVRDLVGEVRRRAARQRRARVLVPAGAVALVAAVTGGVTAGALTGTGGTEAPGARTVLTAALAKTSAQSFTFTASTDQHSGGASGPVTPQGSVAGEFDPVSGTGEEQVRFIADGRQMQIRFVGGHVYSTLPFPAAAAHLSHGKPWLETEPVPQSLGLTPAKTATGFAEDMPVNPADLLALLKSATVVRAAGPASGPGWTGTKYSFTLAPGHGSPQAMSGTVSVDSAGLVRQLVTVGPAVGMVVSANEEVQTLTFGGFGTPVTVSAPPAGQVYNAGDAHLYFTPGVPVIALSGISPVKR